MLHPDEEDEDEEEDEGRSHDAEENLVTVTTPG